VSWSFTTRRPSGSARSPRPCWSPTSGHLVWNDRDVATPGAALTLEVNLHHPRRDAGRNLLSGDRRLRRQRPDLAVSHPHLRRDGIYRGDVPANLVQVCGALGIHVRSGDAEGNTVDQT
jgi:hypothetical protein